MDQVNSELAELAAMELMETYEDDYEDGDEDYDDEIDYSKSGTRNRKIAEFGRVLFLQGLMGQRETAFPALPSPLLRAARVPI
jgi:hypothetical protein